MYISLYCLLDFVSREANVFIKATSSLPFNMASGTDRDLTISQETCVSSSNLTNHSLWRSHGHK